VNVGLSILTEPNCGRDVSIVWVFVVIQTSRWNVWRRGSLVQSDTRSVISSAPASASNVTHTAAWWVV